MFRRLTFAGLALAATMTAAHAAPFSSVDPRAMAMGDVGVALGHSQSSAFYNPSLLTFADPTDDFATGLGFGLRLFDPDKLYEATDDLASAFDGLNDAIDEANAFRDAASYQDVVARLDDLNPELVRVSDKVLQAELGAVVQLSAPRIAKGFSFGLHIANMTHISAVGHYAEADRLLLEQVKADVEAYSVNPTGSYTYIDPYGDITFDVEEELESTVGLRGVAISEVGLALAKGFDFDDWSLSVGLTPKLMRVDVFDYQSSVGDLEIDDIADHTTEHTDANVDIGISTRYASRIAAGLAIKNVIPRTYETETINPNTGRHNKIELKPQARVGIAYLGSFYTLAADFDLTENDPVGFEDGTRYLSIGGELDAWGWAQLRAGYRHDIVNSDRSTISVGIGLSPFRGIMHIDLAVISSDSAIGGAARFGMRF